MKQFQLTFTLLPFLLTTISHSLSGQGPITPTNGFIGREEIAIIWENSGLSGGEDITFNHSLLQLKKDYEIITNKRNRLEVSEESQQMENLGNALINGTSGDFNGDGIDDYIIVSHGANSTIHYSIPAISEMKIDSFILGSFGEGPTSVNGINFKGNILVESGDLSGDGKSEVVVSYIDDQGYIIIKVFGQNEEMGFNHFLTINDEVLADNVDCEKFSIHLADMNNDQKSELLLAFYSSSPGPGAYLKTYSFNKTNSLEYSAHARQLIDADLINGFVNIGEKMSFDLTTGDYDGDSIKEIVFGFSTVNDQAVINLFPGRIMDKPSTPLMDPFEQLIFEETDRFSIPINWNGSFLNLRSGDTNGNGRDDILATGSTSHLLYTQGGLQFTSKLVDYSWGEFVKYADLRDIDNKGESTKEIVLLVNISGDLTLIIYSLTANYSLTLLAEYSLGTSGRNPGSAVLLPGDFNGDIFRIGDGKKYVKTDIVQPLVVLNAPPTHFDKFGELLFDVNRCHNESTCASYATYTSSSSSQLSVSTTLKQSWGVSSTLKAGGKILGVGVEGYLTGSYGKNFEKTTGSSQTVFIQQSVTATYDDQIYATICDYEIWEYIVYNKYNRPSGNILTLKPILTENRWFPSKERSAAGYVPKHEVGNILSYTPYTDLINPDGEDKIRGSYGSDSYDLDANTDVNFIVNLSNTFNSTVVEERNIGIEAGASVSKWGIELSGTASYDRSDLSTHSVSVGDALDINIHLGGVNRSIGETGYNVTPYIYWGINGALVVDYAARPILPEPGGTNTWWSSRYSKPDPAFILPWRLDPEKGLILEDEEKRQQTKSISFSPANPKEGDTVIVRAVINNFSPYPTAGSVPVSFYTGNPLQGGELIESLNGETLFSTNASVGSQAYREISFKWIIPPSLSSFPRVYGYIDPLNTLDEVHKNNNIGWVILNKSDHGGSTNNSSPIAGQPEKVNAFPNPFSDFTTLRVKLQDMSDITVTLFDISGKVVFGISEKSVNMGEHLFNIPGDDLTPGMYFYRIHTREFSESGRLLKIIE